MPSYQQLITLFAIFLYGVAFLPVGLAQTKGSFAYTGTTSYVKPHSSTLTGYTNPTKTLPIPPAWEDSGAQATTSQPTGTTRSFSQTSSVFQNGSDSVDGVSVSYDSIYNDYPAYFSSGLTARTDGAPARYLEDPEYLRKSLFQGFNYSMEYLGKTKEYNGETFEMDVDASFAFPLPDEVHPLIFTPKFTWTKCFLPDEFQEVMGRDLNLFRTGLASRYLCSLNEQLGLDFSFTADWNSDLKTSGSKALRLSGGVSSYVVLNDSHRMVIGVLYTDLPKWKYLPIVGFQCQPSDDCLVDLVFPRPKLARRLVSFPGIKGDSSYWIYLTGEMEENQWLFQSKGNPDLGYPSTELLLNTFDWRILGGLERRMNDDFNWAFEGGVVFSRSANLTETSTSLQEKFSPGTTGMVRLKILY